jgi:hypothetical protein
MDCAGGAFNIVSPPERKAPLMPSLPHRIAGVAAAALLGAASLAPAALAQQSTPPQAAAPAPQAAAPAPMAAPASKSARVETRIKLLHTQLKITPDQETKWDAVADAMRDNAAALDQLAQQRAEQRSHMTAVEDLQSYETIADTHADGLKKLVPAFADLYTAMSDTQKKNADRVFGHRPTTARRSTATPSHG